MERTSDNRVSLTMGVVLARVDSRLVHGQVLEAWVPYLEAEVILVVDRTRVHDPLQQMLVAGYARAALDVRLVTPEEAVDLVAGELAPRRVFVLFPGVGQALEACRCGLGFDRLTLGNIHPQDGSAPVTVSVHLTEEDRVGLAELVRQGIELEARALPSDHSPLPQVLIGGGGGF